MTWEFSLIFLLGLVAGWYAAKFVPICAGWLVVKLTDWTKK